MTGRKFIGMLWKEDGRLSRSGFGWCFLALFALSWLINPMIDMLLALTRIISGRNVDTHAAYGLLAEMKDNPDAYATVLTTGAGMEGFMREMLLVIAENMLLSALFIIVGFVAVFLFIRAMYVSSRKRLRDLEWPVGLLLIPVATVVLRNGPLATAPEIVGWALSAVFFGFFATLILAPGQARRSVHGLPPELYWPETFLASARPALITMPRTRPAATQDAFGRRQFGRRGLS